MDILTGYYRLVKDWENVGETGELVYLLRVTPCDFIKDESHWVDEDLDVFLDHAEFAPDGVQQKQIEMTDLLGDLHKLDGQQTLLVNNADATLCLPGPDAPIESDSRDLVSPQTRSPALMERHIKKVKTMAAVTQKMMVKRQQALAAQMNEQAMILKEKASILQEKMDMASEAIYMINAYLGTDEEIVRIREGERAPESEIVHIRQMILYMDEESAAAENWAVKGGMDFQDIKEFDEWVIQDDHLNQVIPEKKGVVAIKPRRSDKHYSDNPLENQAMNRENKCLYILIRNGDLVYRIYTTLWLRKVLVPRKNEFEHHFVGKWSDKKPIRPGDRDYMDAMKASGRDHRRYYTVMLLLQGILDRTKIFKPLPKYINLCDPVSCTDHVKIIYDAEPHKMLGDGKPSFRNWLNDINGRMERGMRVIGNYDSYYADRYTLERVSPRAASAPDSHTIQTIEAKKENGFIFRYKRKEKTVYDGWGDWRGHAPKNRASYMCYPSDKHIINFDLATIEDMEYYMACRLHRHEYESMLPLLHVTIEAKRAEAEEEEPFRLMLIGGIVKKYDVAVEEANRHVDELIYWWKFKNRTHRALTSEDAKAARMIIKEYGMRMTTTAVSSPESIAHKAFVRMIQKRANVLAIFHRRNYEYVVFYWHDHEENVFALEEHWKYSKKTSEFTRQKVTGWKTIDRRFESWNVLYAHERWDEWEFNARENEHLTKQERELCIQCALEHLKSKDPELWGWREHDPFHWHDDEEEKIPKKKPSNCPLKPLAIVQDKKGIDLYYFRRKAIIPRKLFLTKKAKEPVYGFITVEYKKKARDFSCEVKNVREYDLRLKGVRSERFMCHDRVVPWKEKALRVWESNIHFGIAEEERYEEYEKAHEEMGKPVWLACHQMSAALKERWLEEQHIEFLKEYEDDEEGTFWEMYKEDLEEPRDRGVYHWFDDVLNHLVERKVEFVGMTVEQTMEFANTHGFKLREHFEDEYNKIKDVVIQELVDEEED